MPWSLVPLTSDPHCEDPPAQQHHQQRTHAPNPAYPYQQHLSEARHYGGHGQAHGQAHGQTHGQTHGSSYNRASPSSSSADHWRPPSSGVPGGGRWQGQHSGYYSSHTDVQIPPASSDLRPPHSGYFDTSSGRTLLPPLTTAFPTSDSPFDAVPTNAAYPPYQQSMATSHASLERNPPSSRVVPPLPYARAPPVMSPVSYETRDIQVESQEPTIKKKRKRADARQLEALNRMYARTAFPSTEERQQLAKDLEMSARSVQIWLAHTFVYATCINSDLSTISFRFQNKRQSQRQGGRNPANSGSSISEVAITLPPDPQRPMHPSTTPVPMSPMGEALYPSSRSQPSVMGRSGQTPSPPRSRSRPDMDRRHSGWPGPGPSHGPHGAGY